MRLRLARLAAVAVLAAGCGAGGGGSATTASSTPAGPPGVALEPVVDGLEQPVAALSPPGDPRIFVVEQRTGRVRIVRDGVLAEAPFLDVGDDLSTDGEQGLLGLAFAPDFATSGHVYVNLTDVDGTTRVRRYTAAGDVADPASAVELLAVEQPYANHNGGHLAFGPDGLLWVGLGDGGAAGDPGNRAQDPVSLLGKLLRLDPARPGAAPEVWALGLRNPWRYAFDAETGMLWIGDVGQGDVEEIDRIDAAEPPGANFGWRLLEGSRPFADGGEPPPRYVAPVAEYGHDDGCSVTGGLVVRDPSVPAMDGRYVFGDYCSGRLWALPAHAAPGTAADDVTEQLGGPLEGLVSFGTDGDGHVLVVVQDGRVLRLVGAR